MKLQWNKQYNDAVLYIKSNQKEIDSIANKYMKDWTIDRLSKVDKAIIDCCIKKYESRFYKIKENYLRWIGL